MGWAGMAFLAGPAIAGQLQTWRFDPRQNRLEFQTTTGVQPRAQLLQNPTRLVIDLPDTQLDQPTASQSVGTLVRAVRVGQFEDTMARIVIELAPGYTLDPEKIRFRGIRANQWTVEIPSPEALPFPTQEPVPPTLNQPPSSPIGSPRGFVTNAPTQVQQIQITPESVLIYTTGAAPNFQINPERDRRYWSVDLPDTALPNGFPDEVDLNCLGIDFLQISQLSTASPVVRVTIANSQNNLDWQVSPINSPTKPGFSITPRRSPRGESGSCAPQVIAVSSSVSNPGSTQSPPVFRPSPETPPDKVSIPVGQPENPATVPNPTREPTSPPTRNLERVLVILDPGHGGPDPGAIGIGGVREKDVVLDVSLQVAELLEREGVQVVLTRKDDRDVDLPPRVALAERLRADLFLSIHANSVGLERPEVNGIETFYFSSGQGLASAVQRSLIQNLGGPDRGVKQARFYVIRNTSMPSALTEIGFLTGRQDGPRLAQASYRTRVAEAIAQGVLQYIKQNN